MENALIYTINYIIINYIIITIFSYAYGKYIWQRWFVFVSVRERVDIP